MKNLIIPDRLKNQNLKRLNHQVFNRVVLTEHEVDIILRMPGVLYAKSENVSEKVHLHNYLLLDILDSAERSLPESEVLPLIQDSSRLLQWWLRSPQKEAGNQTILSVLMQDPESWLFPIYHAMHNVPGDFPPPTQSQAVGIDFSKYRKIA